MAENTANKRPKHLWLVFLVPVLVLVAAIAMTNHLLGQESSPQDLTLKNFNVDGTAKTAFGTEIPNSQVASITFVSGLQDAPADAVDVSETGSGRVLLWAVENAEGNQDLFIAGDTAVRAPEDSSYLFGGKEYYRNLKKIDLAGVLDTQMVTNMKGMFYGCSALESLDLSHLDTMRVEAMDWMFSGCGNLKNLDLTGINTEKVMEYGWMFQNCRSLSALDLSSFTAAEGANTFLMFQNCRDLEEIQGPEAFRVQLEEDR